MSKKSKETRKDKPKASKLKIHKDTVQSLSDDELGQVQGGKQALRTFACLPFTMKSCDP